MSHTTLAAESVVAHADMHFWMFVYDMDLVLKVGLEPGIKDGLI